MRTTSGASTASADAAGAERAHRCFPTSTRRAELAFQGRCLRLDGEYGPERGAGGTCCLPSAMSLDPTVTDPDKYKAIFENDRKRVLE